MEGPRLTVSFDNYSKGNNSQYRKEYRVPQSNAASLLDWQTGNLKKTYGL